MGFPHQWEVSAPTVCSGPNNVQSLLIEAPVIILLSWSDTACISCSHSLVCGLGSVFSGAPRGVRGVYYLPDYIQLHWLFSKRLAWTSFPEFCCCRSVGAVTLPFLTQLFPRGAPFNCCFSDIINIYCKRAGMLQASQCVCSACVWESSHRGM